MKQALRQAACELTWVRDGMAALSLLREGLRPELVLLDINLPRMNGLELLGELRQLGLTPELPVIIISTESEPHDIERGLAAGARAYLRKPFRAAELWAAITSVTAA